MQDPGPISSTRRAHTAEEVIALLGLEPLPHEGGCFRETYRSPTRIPPEGLPPFYAGPSAGSAVPGSGAEGRSQCTQIYYLLRTGETSSLHRVLSDECFHFYFGDPVAQLVFDPRSGEFSIDVLGMDLAAGQRPQRVVPAGWWQGACLAADAPALAVPESARRREHGFALLGCTVAPGFEWADFELIDRPRAEALGRLLPGMAELVGLLTPVEGRTRA